MTVLPTGRNHQKEITADKIRRVGGKGLKLQVCWCRNGTKLLIVSVQEWDKLLMVWPQKWGINQTQTLSLHTSYMCWKYRTIFQQSIKKINEPLLAVGTQVHREPNAHKMKHSTQSFLESRITHAMKRNKSFTYCTLVPMALRMTVEQCAINLQIIYVVQLFHASDSACLSVHSPVYTCFLKHPVLPIVAAFLLLSLSMSHSKMTVMEGTADGGQCLACAAK